MSGICKGRAGRCSGYVLKPVTTEQIVRELDNLRHPIEEQPRAKVHMQCFGNFEVFVDGKAMLTT